MPKQVFEIKEFVMNARKPDASKVTIYRPKHKTNITKFKLRTNKYLYTLVVRDKERAKLIETSLPPTLKIEKINPRKETVAPKKK